MSPPNKIHYNHHSPSCIKCKYCNDTHCWKHGCYIRTAFHQKHSRYYADSQRVQRYKCCNPQCRHTFSILPPDVVPYSRFHWKDLLAISGLLFWDTSVYKLAHSTWGLSYRILLHAKVLLNRVKEWFIQLNHETLQINNEILEDAAFLCQKQYSWSDLTWMWGVHIYPCRFGLYLTPHKMDLS